MFRISSRAPLPPRLAAIESGLKKQIAEKNKKERGLTLVCSNKLVRVKNSNATRFVMAMPAGDSPLIEGMAARKFGFKERITVLTTAPREIYFARHRSSTL